MSNTIRIKHGPTAPPDGKLENYELGYVNNGALYIGYDNKSIQLTEPYVIGLINSEGYLNIPKVDQADDTFKGVLVCDDDNNKVYYRKPAQLLNDIGALGVDDGGTINGPLTVNNSLIVGEDNYGDTDPNIAGADGAALEGTTGQLYFVLME